MLSDLEELQKRHKVLGEGVLKVNDLQEKHQLKQDKQARELQEYVQQIDETFQERLKKFQRDNLDINERLKDELFERDNKQAVALEEVTMRIREEMTESDQKISRGLTEALIGETGKIRTKYDEAIRQVTRLLQEEVRAVKQDLEDVNNIKSKEIEIVLEKMRMDTDENIKELKIIYRTELQNIER